MNSKKRVPVPVQAVATATTTPEMDLTSSAADIPPVQPSFLTADVLAEPPSKRGRGRPPKKVVPPEPINMLSITEAAALAKWIPFNFLALIQKDARWILTDEEARILGECWIKIANKYIPQQAHKFQPEIGLAILLIPLLIAKFTSDKQPLTDKAADEPLHHRRVRAKGKRKNGTGEKSTPQNT